MADWKTNTVASTYSAGDQITGYLSKRQGLIDNGTKSIYVNNFGQDSVVGINVNGIPAILVKLRQYKDAIEEQINKLNTSMEKSEQAIHSDEIRSQLQEYFVNVKANLQALVSQLNAFGDKIANVADQYQAFVKGQGTSISQFNAETKADDLYTMQNTNYGSTSYASTTTTGGHGVGENYSSEPSPVPNLYEQ